jgi:predicted enzyme related to lactoylglutathione lyase
MTTEVAAAKQFYGHIVGWRPEDVPMPDMTYTLLHAGPNAVGGMMAMPQSARDGGMKPCWLGYVHAVNVDEAAATLQRRGGTVHHPPADIPTVGRFAMVADPQGAAFYLFQPAPPGAARLPSNAVGHVGWHELHCTDWPKSFDFYSSMFGWLKGDSVDLGPMGTYQLFTINGIAAGGMMNSPAAAAHCFWLYYFMVDDIDGAAGRIAKGGGQVVQAPHQVPGGSWIVQATDPQGARFALVGPRK